MKILTLNIFLGGSGLLSRRQQTWTKADVEEKLKIAAILIHDQQPDLILLQEVDNGKDRSYHINTATFISEYLNRGQLQNFHWEVRFYEAKPHYGVAILSKQLPKRACRNYLGRFFDQNYTRPQENRVAAWEKYRFEDGRIIWVVNIHLGILYEDQIFQLLELRKRIDGTALNKGILLGGDFNIPGDNAMTYAELCTFLNRSQGSVFQNNQVVETHPRQFFDLGPTGAGEYTFPKKHRKIDYLFFSPGSGDTRPLPNAQLVKAAKENGVQEENICSDHHGLTVTL